MKMRILLILLLVGYQIDSYSQSPYFPDDKYVKTRGSKIDSALHIPTGSAPRLPDRAFKGPGALYFSTTDSSVYVWTGFQFRSVGSGSLIQSNGLSKNGDSLKLGGVLDRGTVLRAINVEVNGHKNTKFSITNDTTIAADYSNSFTQEGNLSSSLFNVTKVWRENRGDTLNLQYGGAVTTLFDRMYDSVSSRFGHDKTPIGLTNMGVYAQARFYPPRDSVDVLTSSFGATGSLFAAQLGIGNSYGYKIHIAPADPNNPGLGLSVNKSEIDFVRVIDNSRKKQVTGDGVTSYFSNWKFHQNTMNGSTPKVGSYIEKVFGYQAYGGIYTAIGGSLHKDSILKIAKVNESFAYYAHPQWRPNNEVYNGYGFVSAGEFDYNHFAGKFRVGGSRPSKDNNDLLYQFEANGYSRINSFRLDSIMRFTDVDSLYNGTFLMSLANRGTAPVLGINRQATSWTKFMTSAPEAALVANSGFSGLPEGALIVPHKAIFGRSIYNFQPHPDSAGHNTTVALNSVSDFYGAGIAAQLTSGSRVANTTSDTLIIKSPITGFGMSAMTAHIDFAPNSNANTKHLGTWSFYNAHWDNANVRGWVEKLIGYRIQVPESATSGRMKVANYYGLYTDEMKYNTDIGRAWAIYINAPLSYNYFSKNVMIGDTTVAELGSNFLYVKGGVRIADGTEANGYVLTSDANGNASWQAPSGVGGGGITPAGNNGNIQFNNSGSLSATDSLDWNGTRLLVHSGPDINTPNAFIIRSGTARSTTMGNGASNHFYIQNTHGSDANAGIVFRNRTSAQLASFANNGFSLSTSGVARISGSATDLVVNSTGVDFDFKVLGDNDANLLFADAGNDRIGIGTGSPAFKLDVNGIVNTPGTTSATFRWNEAASEAPATTTYSAPTNYVGASSSYALMTPDAWLRVNVNGTAYLIPAYQPTTP